MTSRLHTLAKKAALPLLYRLPASPMSLHGTLFWIHPRARFSMTTLTFFRGEHHVHTWLEEQLRPGHVFFDVGAHHGWDSMWALPLVGKSGLVVSFEPSPANLATLRWHRSRNHFAQWEIIPKAVADIDAEANFFLVDAGDSPMNSLTTGASGAPFMSGQDISKTSVQTIALDTFCRQFGRMPDLVKIDVEGAELLVLRGAVELLSDSRPTVILAVHPYWLPAGHSPRQLFELLAKNGYHIYDSRGALVQYLQEGEYLCLGARMRTVP